MTIKDFIITVVSISILSVLTIAAYAASRSGFGLPAKLDQPVNIREESVTQRRPHSGLVYFGESRHYHGGGFHGGK